jgi:hypothetical protein
MMRRVAWFAAGAAAGVSGSYYAKRKMREAAERYKPVNVARGAAGRVADALREGRSAMAQKEAELRNRQDAGAATRLPAPERVEVVIVNAAEVVPPHRGVSGPRRRSRR